MPGLLTQIYSQAGITSFKKNTKDVLAIFAAPIFREVIIPQIENAADYGFVKNIRLDYYADHMFISIEPVICLGEQSLSYNIEIEDGYHMAQVHDSTYWDEYPIYTMGRDNRYMAKLGELQNAREAIVDVIFELLPGPIAEEIEEEISIEYAPR